MSRLSRFMGKPIEVDFEGVVLEIHPLTLQHIDLLTGMQDPKRQGEAIRKVVELTLRKSVPDATKEELENFSMEHFEKLFNSIAKVNKLDTKDASSGKIKQLIEQRSKLQG